MDNKFLNKTTVESILKSAPANLDKRAILDDLIKRGYDLEGVDNEAVRTRLGVVKPQPTFGQKVVGIVKERANKASDAQAKSISGEQSLGSGVLQTIGQGAGAVGDVALEGLKAITPDVIEKPVGKAIEKGIGAVVQTEPVQDVMAKYQEWAKQHPEAAANLGATLNIASLLPVGKGGQVAGDIAETVGKKGVATTLDVATGAKNLASKGVSELSGSMTGLNRGGNQALADALAQGGEQAKIARQAMRGKLTAQDTEQVAKEALDSVIQERNKKYLESLSSLKENKKSYDVSPVLNNLDNELKSFQVGRNADGTLDFSQSPLRFNTKAKNDIETIVSELKDFGLKEGDRTVVGLDSLKRAFSDLYTESGEARKFVASMQKSVSNVLKEIPGYEQMAKGYGESTGLIKDIQKNLSLGTRAGTDTAYRKFSQILRKDNDARKALFAELDKASGGKLAPMVAGTMASEVLPRGLTRPLSGLLAGGAGIESGSLGVAMKALLGTFIATSPRVAGEVINLLNIPKKALKPAQKALDKFIAKESVIPNVKKAISEAKKNLKNPSNAQGGFIDLGELKSSTKSSPKGKGVIPETNLINEAKKYKSAEEFTTNSTELTYKNLQENPYSIKIYGKDFNEPVEYYRAGAIRKNGDIWLTDNQAGAQQYSSAGGGTKVGSYIVNSKKPLIIDTAGGKYANGNIDINKILTKEEIAQGYTNNPDIKAKLIQYAKDNGYDAVQFADSFPDGEGGMRSLVVWNKDQIKTKSQLEEIWKKANKK